MTPQELTQKIQSGNGLSEAEQKELFVFLDKEFNELKVKQPQKYLELLTHVNGVLTSLNSKLQGLAN